MKKQNITFNEELYEKNIAYYVGFRRTLNILFGKSKINFEEYYINLT